jgi:flagella basal body P-ring formation protein FlgA
MASTVAFAQGETNQEIYSKVVLACEENKMVKTTLAVISKKSEKVTDAYDKSERNEKAKYERNASELEIIKAEGPKVIKAYSDCLKTKMQAKEFRNQGNKVTVNVSARSDGRIVNNSTATAEKPVKQGKATVVQAPKITVGKSLWCEDEANKCYQVTIVIEQK